MFGASSTSPFASPPAGGAATPFGAPVTGGFGAASPAPFGASTTPGTTATTPGGFGGFGAAPAPATGGFGGFGAPAPAPSAFGTPAATGATPGFGASATPFGAPAPAPAGGLFGAPAPAGGGLFGGGATATTGGFGATAGAGTPAGGGLFGGGAATGTTSGFGATNTTAGGFGTTSAFGATSSTTPAFGATPAPASGGLFGGGVSTAPTFGAPAPSAFGAPAPAAGGLFGGGAAAPVGGGLFGGGAAAKPGTLATPYSVTSKSDGSTTINIQAITAMPQYEAKSFEELRFEDYQAGNKGSMGQPGAAAPVTGGFGTTGAFGAPAPTPVGLFGAPAPAPAFGASTTGAFGAPAPAAPSAFGAPAPAFGAPAPAPGGFSFGGAAPAPAATGFGFGAKPPAPGGLFSSSTPAPSSATGGLFGSPTPAPAPGGLFGAPAPAPAVGGLFGSPAPAPVGGGLFGAPAPAPATGGLFGAPAPAPAGGGLFGAPVARSPGAGLFGAPAPAPVGGGLFGAPAPAPAGGGLFGAPAPAAPAGGLFGAPVPTAPACGLFGAPAPAAPVGGMFGAPAAAPVAPLSGSANFGAATVPPPTADALLAQQLAAVENQKKDLALLEAWRGKSPGGSSVIPASLSERDSSTSYGSSRKGKDVVGTSTYAASSAALLSYQAAPRSAARIRPRGFGPLKSPISVGPIGGGGSGSPMLSPDAFLGSSAKRLVIKPGSLTPKPKIRLLLTNGERNDIGNGEKLSESQIPNGVNLAARLETSPPAVSPTVNQSQYFDKRSSGLNSTSSDVTAAARNDTFASPSSDTAQTLEEKETETSLYETARNGAVGTPQETPRDMTKLQSALKKKTPQGNGSSYEFYRQVVGSPDSTQQTTPIATPNQKEQVTSGSKFQEQNDHHVPKLTTKGYSMTPSFEDLKAMSEADLAAVSNFVVEREGFGSVAWDGAVDVRGIDLDRVISIEHKDVAVYDAEEAEGTKPPVGSKLNRPAVITMCKVFPKNDSASTPDAKSKFERKLAKTTKKMGAEFIAYDADRGIWKFRVLHFSRYKMVDDSDESDNEGSSTAREQQTSALVEAPENFALDFETGGRGGHPRTFMDCGGKQNESTKIFSGGLSRIRAPISDDEEMSERTEDDSIALMSEGALSEGDNDTRLIQEADAAYAAVFQASMQHMSNSVRAEKRVRRHLDLKTDRNVNSFYPDECETISEYLNGEPKPLHNEIPCRSKKSISAEIARKILTTSSSTDFGMRMGRSFRVGWRSDGSFITPVMGSNNPTYLARGKNSVLVQRRPVLAYTGNTTRLDVSHQKYVALLKTHLKNCFKVQTKHNGCPIFSLPRAKGSTKGLSLLLEDYAKTAFDFASLEGNSESSKIVHTAFSLMAVLFGDDSKSDDLTEETKSTLSERRYEALSRWLRESSSHGVLRDIKSAQSKGDTYSAIFAALSGGDIPRAASIALESGHLKLSCLLMSCGQQSVSDLETQMHHWHETNASNHIPSGLIRIFSLLSGNLQLEENLFKNGGLPERSAIDWRRRLGMKIWNRSKSSEQQKSSISSVVQEYSADVEVDSAPQPVPWYTVDSNPSLQHVECILFSLLRLYQHYESGSQYDFPLASIISPLGHTESMHDFSVSFHFAAVLSALGCVPLMPLPKQESLIDSYCAQLVSVGLWEWAVYVSLCVFDGIPDPNTFGAARVQKAKRLVTQHYNVIHPTSCSRRSFLEEVGIPSIWFDEVLAGRCAFKGDSIGHVNHLMRCSFEDAIGATEELVLPYLLFNGGDDSQKLLQTLDALRGDDDSNMWNSSLCGVIYNYLTLTKETFQFSKISRDERSHLSDYMRQLEIKAIDIENNLRVIEKENKDCKGKLSSRCTGVNSVSRSVYIAEALSGLSFIRLQLRAIQSGFHITDSDRRLKLASQLASLSIPEDKMYALSSFSGSLAYEGSLRGYSGLA